MEAKDTVIPVSKCPYQPDGESDELYVDLGKLYQEKFMQGARKQASISFKAGQDSRLKEVKEWIDNHSQIVSPVNDKRIIEDGIWHLTTARQLYEEEWQAFLKGLEGDKK